jgi:hypothetical protein
VLVQPKLPPLALLAFFKPDTEHLPPGQLQRVLYPIGGRAV